MQRPEAKTNLSGDIEEGARDVEFTPFTRAVRRLENVPAMAADNKSDQLVPTSTGSISIKPKMWRVCGSEIDPRPVLFFTQLAISAVIIAFCLFQLITRGNCDAWATYGTTLMFIVGVYLPTPLR